MVWRPSLSQDATARDLECRKPKAVGEPYEGIPHGRFEVAGGGNQDLGPRRYFLTLPAERLQVRRESRQTGMVLRTEASLSASPDWRQASLLTGGSTPPRTARWEPHRERGRAAQRGITWGSPPTA